MQKDKPGMLREFMELVGLVLLLLIKAFFNGFALFKAIEKKVSVFFFSEKYYYLGAVAPN
jgi:hypothetical protein